MTRPASFRGRGWRSILLAGLITLAFALLTPPRAALAPPLHVYLQATYLTVAPQVLPLIRAVIVTILGAAITLRGLVNYLG